MLLKKDKVAHFLIGCGFGLVTGGLVITLGLNTTLGISPVATAFIAATIAGAVKEVWDMFTPGHEEVADFVVTSLGGLVAATMLSFIV